MSANKTTFINDVIVDGYSDLENVTKTGWVQKGGLVFPQYALHVLWCSISQGLMTGEKGVAIRIISHLPDRHPCTEPPCQIVGPWYFVPASLLSLALSSWSTLSL